MPKKAPVKGKAPAAEPAPSAGQAEPIRLNKFLAHGGVAARRKADELIRAGRVTVNEAVVTEMGHLVQPGDRVAFDGKPVKLKRFRYVLLNKPRGFITTTDDERDRRTVMDLVAKAGPERLYPVGRLDRQTSGLLLLTNDGELAERLMHPRYEVEKVYAVSLDRPLSERDRERIAAGLVLEDGPIAVDGVHWPDPERRQEVGVALHSGRNRIVRRIFEHLGYRVVHLDRTVYAGLTKRDLPRGKWRLLKPAEVAALKHFGRGQRGGTS